MALTYPISPDEPETPDTEVGVKTDTEVEERLHTEPEIDAQMRIARSIRESYAQPATTPAEKQRAWADVVGKVGHAPADIPTTNRESSALRSDRTSRECGTARERRGDRATEYIGS